MAEDRREPPFEGGSQPVPHEKDPLPGPAQAVGKGVALLLSFLVLAAVVVYVFAR